MQGSPEYCQVPARQWRRLARALNELCRSAKMRIKAEVIKLLQMPVTDCYRKVEDVKWGR
eukprot:4594986-Amphidinium_carterae.1